MQTEKDLRMEYHFNDLPQDILVELEHTFHKELFSTFMKSKGLKSKISLGDALNIPPWKAPRLIDGENRISVGLLELLRLSCQNIDAEKFSSENVEKNISSLGTHADKRVHSPKFPFRLADLVYVYSHLIFDGSARRKGTYFMAAENELLKYHRNRLQDFGKVETNFIEKEKQLYIPWVLAYLVKKIFSVNSFKSLGAIIPSELKNIAIDKKEIANEIIKAAIIDEGWVEDKISFAISNEKLCKDIWEIAKAHYGVGNFPEKPRERIGITGKKVSEWRWIILSKSMKDFYENIELPLSHKQERVKFAVKRQSREWYKRKPNETKKLIIQSLLKSPKSIKELSFELNVRTTSILNLINGIHCRTQNTDGLKDYEIIGILEYRTNTKGERTGKFPIYYVIDKDKAEEFVKNN
ncbi:MAG: hypothetical protein HZB67_03295 [Candidatus Aenigmarchaeota archaeon]|nr:hypothetical protein [Candidatus Aenigmarchaeota archaeon]